MENQHKVIPILAGILFSDGILAQSAGGELYPPKASVNQSMPSTDVPAISKKAESLNKNYFVQFDKQLVNEPIRYLQSTPSNQKKTSELITNSIDNSKKMIDIPGLLTAIKETKDVVDHVASVNKEVTKIAESISTKEAIVSQLSKNLNKLNNEISKSTTVIATSSTDEAIKLMSTKLHMYETESAKIIVKMSDLDTKVVALDKELEIAKDAASKVSQLKDGSFLSKSLKVADFAGKALTVANIINETTKINERIESGSSLSAELLTISLIGVESFQPSIPFTKSPSDVARSMIDLTSDLKERNAAFVNFNESFKDNVYQLLNGGANFNAFLARNLSQLSPSTNTFYDELIDSYELSKSQYLQPFEKIIAEAELQKDKLQQLYNDAWLDDSKSMYKSLITGIEQGLVSLKSEKAKIVDFNKGYSVLGEYANWYVQNKLVGISNEISSESDNLTLNINSLEGLSGSITNSKLITNDYNESTTESKPNKAKEVIEKKKEPVLSGPKEYVPLISHCVGAACADQEDKAQEKLNHVTSEINSEESALAEKKRQLDDLNKKLKSTSQYTKISKNSTSKSYDTQKLRYLNDAKVLFARYGNKPITDWSKNDKEQLEMLAQKLGITWSTLHAQLRLGHYDYLRDKYTSTIITTTTVETVENLDYKNIQGQISDMTIGIKSLNQDLTLDKMQQSAQQMAVNNLQDVNNTNKVTETQNNAPTHDPYWVGGYTANYYNENNLGEPNIFGFGDGPAETRTIKPGLNKQLYLLDPQNYSVDKTITLNRTEAEYFGSYNYVAWGTWSDPNAADKVYTSHWVVVDQIDRDQKPKQGTASYAGELRGTLWTIGQDNSAHNANGNISMTANFGTNAINGNLQVNNADTNTAFATASFNTNMTTTADGDSLKFQGQLTGPGISNQQTWHSGIRGEFGGNQAAEVGGTWSITKGTGNNGDGQATGVFRAEKQ